MDTLFSLSSLSGHSDSFSLFLKVVLQSNIFFSVSTEQNRTKIESSIPIEWSRVGISCIKDLFIDNTFALFQQISNRFSLPKNHFFRYLQVRSFITNTYREFPLLTDETPLDMFFKASFSLFTNQITLCVHILWTPSKIPGPTDWGLVFQIRFEVRLLLIFINVQFALNIVLFS